MVSPAEQLAAEYPQRIALLDCNSFYAACEVAADPRLRGRPVAVLSLNDGMVIAANYEAKQLGVGLGTVYFKEKARLARLGVVVKSAHFEYYAAKSAEIMQYLHDKAPVVEVYSIDEAWLDLSGLVRFHDVTAFARTLRAELLQATGVSVSVGIATSKVLAKLANKTAKQKRTTFVEVLTTAAARRAALEGLPLNKLWGVAAGTERRLNALGARTALEAALLPDRAVDRACGIVGVRLVQGLRGVHSIPLETEGPARKHVSSSRSFKTHLTQFDDLDAAVAFYVQRCCEKLHQHRLAARHLELFLRTDYFAQDPYYKGTRACTLPTATAYPPAVYAAARALLRAAYEPGRRYKKAGLVLSGLVPADSIQPELFQPPSLQREHRLVRLVNALNGRRRDKRIDYAAFLRAGQNTRWAPRSELRTEIELGDRSRAETELIKPWW